MSVPQMAQRHHSFLQRDLDNCLITLEGHHDWCSVRTSRPLGTVLAEQIPSDDLPKSEHVERNHRRLCGAMAHRGLAFAYPCDRRPSVRAYDRDVPA